MAKLTGLSYPQLLNLPTSQFQAIEIQAQTEQHLGPETSFKSAFKKAVNGVFKN